MRGVGIYVECVYIRVYMCVCVCVCVVPGVWCMGGVIVDSRTFPNTI